MVKSFEEAVSERKAYVKQVRESFMQPTQENERDKSYPGKTAGEKEEAAGERVSGFGIKALIAVLLFAAFVYCDREKVTFQKYGAEDIISQIEWNLLPMDEWRDIIRITK